MIDWDKVSRLRREKDMTYLEISKLLGINYGTIRNHYSRCGRVDRHGYTNWSKHVHLLGVISDKELAKRLGIKIGTVVQKRRRAGIGPLVVSQRVRELEVQKMLVSGLVGFREFVRLDCGIADVVTNDTIYEVKIAITTTSVQRAIGQLLLYSYSLPNHKMCIVGGSKKINKHTEKRLKEIGIETLIV